MGKNEFDASRLRQAIGAARIALGKPGATVDSVGNGDVIAAGIEDLNIELTEAEATEGLKRAREVLSENVVEFPVPIPVPEDRSELVPNLVIGASALLIAVVALAGIGIVFYGLAQIHRTAGPLSIVIYGVLLGAGARLSRRVPDAAGWCRMWWSTLYRKAKTLGEAGALGEAARGLVPDRAVRVWMALSRAGIAPRRQTQSRS